MRLHLGMMVKDRESSVGRALESARHIVDGYTILDTGSTDGTRAICERYGKVRDVPWTGDYGEMRTKVMHACEEDGATWYLMLDSDEEITDAGDIRAALADAEARELDAVMVDCIPITLHGRQPSEPNFRLIRLGLGMYWQYAYDEQLRGWRKDRIRISTLSIDQDYRRSFEGAHAARFAYLSPMRARSREGSPDWCHATYFLMRSFASVNDYETAEKYALALTQAMPKAIGFATAWKMAAWSAMRRGDTAAAWARLQDGVRNHPGMADLWHLIAVVACGRIDECCADVGPYFPVAQVAPGIQRNIPDALRALGCSVELAEAT